MVAKQTMINTTKCHKIHFPPQLLHQHNIHYYYHLNYYFGSQTIITAAAQKTSIKCKRHRMHNGHTNTQKRRVWTKHRHSRSLGHRYNFHSEKNVEWGRRRRRAKKKQWTFWMPAYLCILYSYFSMGVCELIRFNVCYNHCKRIIATYWHFHIQQHDWQVRGFILWRRHYHETHKKITSRINVFLRWFRRDRWMTKAEEPKCVEFHTGQRWIVFVLNSNFTLTYGLFSTTVTFDCCWVFGVHTQRDFQQAARSNNRRTLIKIAKRTPNCTAAMASRCVACTRFG